MRRLLRSCQLLKPSSPRSRISRMSAASDPSFSEPQARARLGHARRKPIPRQTATDSSSTPKPLGRWQPEESRSKQRNPIRPQAPECSRQLPPPPSPPPGLRPRSAGAIVLSSDGSAPAHAAHPVSRASSTCRPTVGPRRLGRARGSTGGPGVSSRAVRPSAADTVRQGAPPDR